VAFVNAAEGEADFSVALLLLRRDFRLGRRLMRVQKLTSATLPSWSPDGQWIAYISNDIKESGLYIMNRICPARKVLDASGRYGVVGVGTGGHQTRLLFATQNGSIYKISVSGGDPIRLSGPGNDSSPAWSN
jgi:Tol biopolymer transport system component